MKSRLSPFCCVAILAILSLAPSLAATLGPVQPGPTFTVTNLTDSNDGSCTVDDCSLREALDAANADPNPNTIEFSPGLTGTIHIATFNPFFDYAFVVSAPVAILGPGARFVAISGESSAHVFVVNSQDVSISGLTLTNGRPNNANGGAVLNQGGLTLTDCTISNSSSTGSSGGNGGGLYNSANATATLTGCTFSTNTASQFGGGGVFNAGQLTATNCTFTDNSAPSGGGILTVSNGTSLTTLRNCTITNNTATSTGSSAAGGGGYYGEGAVGNSLHHFSNTILAGNHNAVNPDLRGYGTTEGNNLIGNLGAGGSGFSNGVNGDKAGVSAQFDSFLNFGGPTNTWSLLATSPAINAGNDALAPATDQRGNGRVGTSDIGAFEFGSVGLRITRLAVPNNDIVIYFTSAVAGSVYRLERKLQLTQPTWQADPGFPDFKATANGEYAIDYAGGRLSHAPPVFYRITLIP
jgi:CSLREA domain-containing protein